MAEAKPFTQCRCCGEVVDEGTIPQFLYVASCGSCNPHPEPTHRPSLAELIDGDPNLIAFDRYMDTLE